MLAFSSFYGGLLEGVHLNLGTGGKIKFSLSLPSIKYGIYRRYLRQYTAGAYAHFNYGTN